MGHAGAHANGSLVGNGDAVDRTRRASENIGHGLTAAGGDFGNVVEFTTYVAGGESTPGYLQGHSEV